jgi:hypothetical protein
MLIAGLVTLLIGLGWSRSSATHGAVWTLVIFIAAFLISASSRFSRFEALSANDLWSPGPSAGSQTYLQTSLHDLSFWDQGQLQSNGVEVRLPSQSLAWLLRDLPAAGSEAAPAFAITSGVDQPAEFASYRGQSFALGTHRAWQDWPPNFLAWLLFRRAPLVTEQIILWVRADVFLDGGLSQQP